MREGFRSLKKVGEGGGGVVAVWRAKKWLILMIVIPTEGTSVLVPMENMVKS
jgi:hypothetical protein